LAFFILPYPEVIPGRGEGKRGRNHRLSGSKKKGGGEKGRDEFPLILFYSEGC